MEGFFSLQEMTSKSRPQGKKLTCVSCGLYKNCEHPKMEPWGNFKKGILIIGESPTQREDKVGRPWVDQNGKNLERILSNLGIDLFEDCLSTFSCQCRTVNKDGEDRPPTNIEVESCRKTVLKIIDERSPTLVLLLGNSALFSVIGDRWKRDLGNIEKWRGWAIPDTDFNCWLCPTYSPSVLDNGKKDHAAEETIWTQDLEHALEKLESPFPKYKKPNIEIIDDLTILNKIKSDFVVIDYETTGIKPQGKGHRIVCASVADTPDHAFVFMMPKSKKERKPFTDLLENNLIGKGIHNAKYEITWTKVRLNTEIKNVQFDSLLAAHLIDNRPGVTGLKFLAFVYLGIPDYDSEISSYLHAKEDNGNAINQIMELVDLPGGKEKLMTYCALDTIYTYRLSLLQMNEMNFNFLPF